MTRTAKSPVLAKDSDDRPWALQTWQYSLPLGLGFVSTILILLFALLQQSISIVLVYSLLLAVGLTLVGVVVGKEQRRGVRALFLSIYAYNVILAILFYLTLESRYGVPYLFGGTDDLFFDMGGRKIANSIAWLNYGAVPVVGPPSKFYGYLYTVGLTHKLGDALGGSHTLVPRLLNGFVGAWIPVLLYFVALSCRYSPNTANRAAYTAGFYPLMAFHAAVILRDTIIGFLALCIIHGVLQIRFKRQRWRTHTLPVVVAAVVLWEFRDVSVVAIGLVLSTAFAYVWVLRVRRAQRWFGAVLALILLAMLVGALGIALSGSRAVGEMQTATQKYRLLMERKSASDSLGVRLVNLPIPLNYLARTAYALIDPLPVPTSDFPRLWKSFGAMLWYGLLPFFLLGLPSQLRSPQKSFLAMVSIGLFLGIAFTTLHDRHAVHYAPVFILFGVDGFERFRRYRLPVSLFGVWAFVWVICIYIVFKFVY